MHWQPVAEATSVVIQRNEGTRMIDSTIDGMMCIAGCEIMQHSTPEIQPNRQLSRRRN
jgi:hypothetical protein